MDHLNKLQKKVLNEPLFLAYLLGFHDVNTEVHEHWIRSIWYSGSDSIQGHRGSFKTTCTQLGILWGLFFKPNTVIKYYRKTYDEAEDTVFAIRQFYESDPIRKLYHDGWGIKSVRTSVWARGEFTLATKTKITKEPGVSAGGFKTFATGSHYDKIICDDIITMEDRVSKKERESTKLNIYELKNLINPGGEIKYRGTPWHPNDAWKLCPAPEVWPVGSIDIPKFTPQYVRQLEEESTPSLFAANYKLVHITDEGRLFGAPIYGNYPESGNGTFGVLDPAYGGHHVALAIGGMVGENIHVKGFLWDVSVFQLYPQILKILREHKVGTLFVEKNADKGATATDLYNLRGGNVVAFPTKENKHIKIVSTVKKHWKNIRWAHDTEEDFLNEVLDYQEGQEPDDAPDSVAMLIRIIQTMILRQKGKVGKIQYVNIK
ncbi:terminase large subunit [Leptospira phage LE4]|uniref:Terminase large subunit n=1 Tax=Leptospira phage LE4 TaxID=2041383 RepID=A0A343LEC2_9CAUD|nr:terminase large subunit [Leptospira phage LE4]ATN95032.1 terminase large subunit [Leptospira phage LE4]